MIYECPQCEAPQEAGATVCPRCHAHFDGPVPEDAIVPPPLPRSEPPASPVSAALGGTEPGPSVLEEVKPPAPEPPEAFPPPAPYMPPYSAPDAAPPPHAGQPLAGLSRALLFAFPIVLVLILGGVYFANTVNTGSDATPAPAAVVKAPPPPAAPPAPIGSPVYLPGSANATVSDADRRTKILVGRWASKALDFYVFNADGTGSRGNEARQQDNQSFLWGLVQNRIMLYTDKGTSTEKNEMLRFSAGPDDNTVFLGPETGHYIQFERAKT